MGKVSSIFSDAGDIGAGVFGCPATGRYHVKLAGYSIWVSGGGIGRWFRQGQQAEKKAAGITCRCGIGRNWMRCGRAGATSRSGIYANGNGGSQPVGVCDFTPQPTVCDVDVTLVAGEGLQTDAMRLFRTRVNGTDEQYVNPLATEDGIPGYAVQWLEVEGPFYDDAYGSGYQLLFGNLPLRRSAPVQPGVSLDGVPGMGGGRSGRGGGAGAATSRTPRWARACVCAPTVVEVDSANPERGCAAAAEAFYGYGVSAAGK